jgi:hypothetical protein
VIGLRSIGRAPGEEHQPRADSSRASQVGRHTGSVTDMHESVADAPTRAEDTKLRFANMGRAPRVHVPRRSPAYLAAARRPDSVTGLSRRAHAPGRQPASSSLPPQLTRCGNPGTEVDQWGSIARSSCVPPPILAQRRDHQLARCTRCMVHPSRLTRPFGVRSHASPRMVAIRSAISR